MGRHPAAATVSGGSLTVNSAHVNDTTATATTSLGRSWSSGHFGPSPSRTSASEHVQRSAVGDVQHRRRRRRSTAAVRATVDSDDGASPRPGDVTNAIEPNRAPTAIGSSGRATDVKFYVDGGLVATHAIAIEPMRPVISDLTTDTACRQGRTG